MENKLIYNAKLSEFKLPAIFLMAAAYVIFIVGEMIGGNGAIALANRISFLHHYENNLSLIFTATTPILVFLWIKFIENRSIKGIGLSPNNFLNQTLKGSAIGFVAFTAILIITMLFDSIKFTGINFNPKIVLGVLLLLPCWFIQASSEEILIRGWLLPNISAKYGKIIGVLLSSLVFTALHFENPHITVIALANIFIVALLFALMTLNSESLWPAISFHALWNFTQSAFWGLSVSGNRPSGPYLFGLTVDGNSLITGGKFGIEGSIITTIILLTLTCYALFIHLKKQRSL